MNLAKTFIDILQKEKDKVAFLATSANQEVIWQKNNQEILLEVSYWINALNNYAIVKGDMVAVSLGKSSNLVPVHIALLAIGAIIIPLNPALSAREIEQIFLIANIKLIISKSDLLMNHSNLVNSTSASWWLEGAEKVDLPNTFNFTNLLKDPSLKLLEEIESINKNDLALLLFTSGTTGKPKGVGITHSSLISNLSALLIDTWQCTSKDRLLHVLPPYHVHGLGLGIYGSLLIGNTCIFLEKFDPLVTLRAIKEQQISFFMGVPTMYHRMLQTEGEFNFSSMQLFTSGSAPLNQETFYHFKQRFGFTIVERYGLTETLFNASNPLDNPKANSVGQAIKGVELGIFDPQTFEKLVVNETGEIWVKGENVFQGYWQEPEITQDAFYQGWFRTGDLGKFDKDNYLFISGRIKELIIVGGNNVIPGEIEKVLSANPDVLECAVTAINDKDLGEKIIACIVAKETCNLLELETCLRKTCQQNLAPYKHPKGYKFVSSLPRNFMGKLERKKLVDLANS